MPRTPNETELARAAAGGDREAFASLVSGHYDRLFALCFRLTGRREEAEDLVQDICLSLPARLAGFEGRARFSTWLYRVAVNAAHDRRRRAAAHARAAEAWGEWDGGRRADAADTGERVDWLRRAMAELPQDLRDTVALVVDDEMTHAEAAEALGVSEGTLSWRLSEVRRRLRALRQRELTP